jgi:hypothetical protein
MQETKKNTSSNTWGRVDLLCRCLSGRSWTNKNFAWYISPYTTVNPKAYTTIKTLNLSWRNWKTCSCFLICFALLNEEEQRLQKKKCMHSANGEIERRRVVPQWVATMEDWRRAHNISTLCSWCNTPPTANAWIRKALRNFLWIPPKICNYENWVL